MQIHITPHFFCCTPLTLLHLKLLKVSELRIILFLTDFCFFIQIGKGLRLSLPYLPVHTDVRLSPHTVFQLIQIIQFYILIDLTFLFSEIKLLDYEIVIEVR